MVVVEAFVVIRFPVAVQIVEADDLVAAADINSAVAKLQTERLEQTGRDPLPGETPRGVFESAHHPHVAVPRTYGDPLAVRIEIEPGQSKLRIPRVILGQTERIHGE